MELPVLEALRAALPSAEITALGAEPATQLLEGHGAVDEVVALNRWEIRHRWDWGPADAARGIARWLDEHDFDLFLDVHHVPPIFAELISSRRGRSLLSEERVEREMLHGGASGVTAICAAVQAGWGLSVPCGARPRLTLSDADRGFAQEYVDSRGLAVEAPIAISPVASLPLKQWPLQRLARLADSLVEEMDEPVLAFCGPQRSAGHELLSYMRHPEQLVRVGPLPLLRIAALLERCRALVCNDTGLMHIAGAVQLPTVAVFGPTAPSIYRPKEPSMVSVGGEAVECPHRNTESLHPPECFAERECLLAGHGCIHDVPEEEVRAALDALLGWSDSRPVDARSVA